MAVFSLKSFHSEHIVTVCLRERFHFVSQENFNRQLNSHKFSSFFIHKISIRRSFFSSGSCSSVLNPPDTGKVLQKLTCVIDDEVRQLVLLAPCKLSEKLC